MEIGAGGGNRTHTPFGLRILSPPRLPVPPHQHVLPDLPEVEPVGKGVCAVLVKNMVWQIDFPAELALSDGCVVAIGNFDGVHQGHRALLAQAQEDAGGLPLVVLTFEPHPRTVLFPDKPLHRLTELPEKVRLLGEAGASGVAVVPFNREVAAWSPQKFIDGVLVDWLGARRVVVGADFRFGAKAAGDVETLCADGRFTVTKVALLCDAGGDVFSSRRLRGDG